MSDTVSATPSGEFPHLPPTASAEPVEPAQTAASTAPVPVKPKKDTIPKIFMDRMKFESRDKEFRKEIKRVMAETGKRYGPASWIAMRNFGYTTPEFEREQELRRKIITAAPEIVAEQEKLRVAKGLGTLEEAVRQLPATASPSKEAAWIKAHPRLLQRARDNKVNIILTADDVMSPPHGQAPSAWAVTQLQYWITTGGTQEFFKQILSEERKAVEADQAQAAESQDPSLEEVKRLLKEVSKAARASAREEAKEESRAAETDA